MNEPLVDTLLPWYDSSARDLPWRRPDVGAWAVLVCEVMSHQTPVSRVVPAWRTWLERWPSPTDLAGDSPGEAVRLWGRLGYPRRALRLHQAAVVVRDRHDGEVPGSYEELLALPGIGPYTAGATAAFAHRQRAVVLDVNVRRVLARVCDGTDAAPGAPSRAEVARAERLLPSDAERSVRWNAAVMELGALVCTARAPRCEACPLAGRCAWFDTATTRASADNGNGNGNGNGSGSGSGSNDDVAPSGRSRAPRTTRPQAWAGTDRYVRGLLLAALRAEHGTVTPGRLDAVWQDPEQTARCLAGLLTDGLAEAAPGGYRLPTG